MSTTPSIRPFSQVDVFGFEPYLGNPVAVVLNADGVSADDMQQLARWTNLSETTFVLPPSTKDADYGVRIFTPGGELPFAGHPTLGTAHAWVENGGRPASSTEIVQECAAGLVRVRADGGAYSFAAPPTLRGGPLDEDFVGTIARAFGIDRDAVIDHQWVDNGPGWAVVRLTSAREVLALEPDFSELPEIMVGAIGAHPAGAPHAYELRTFAPGVGVFEDPVCGSMNASVAQWFLRTGVATAGYRVSQGARVGRAGDIEVGYDDDGTAWIGGRCATLIQGTVLL